MCDIYGAKCQGCGRYIDMHLADFATGRDEVDVWCSYCIPDDRNAGVVWLDDDGGRIFVKSLTENARSNWDGNHPNAAWAVAIEAFGVSTGKKQEKT
jgi:hypothetical protein